MKNTMMLSTAPASAVCAVAGAVGGAIASGLGGWDKGLIVLIVMMGIDYLTGLFVAIAGKSPKTESGKLSSRAGFRGIIKKAAMLLMVAAMHLIDWLLGVQYLRDAVIIALVTNELISFTENYSLLGLPLPEPVVNVIEVLSKRNEKSIPAEVEGEIYGNQSNKTEESPDSGE